MSASKSEVLTKSNNFYSNIEVAALTTPYKKAVIACTGRDKSGYYGYKQLTFSQLEAACCDYAYGLAKEGVKRGTRVLMMARPSLDFISLTFALFKIGAIPVFVDPGMGLDRMLICAKEAEPEFLIGEKQAIRLKNLKRNAFKSIKKSFCVERKKILGSTPLQTLRISPLQQTLTLDVSESDSLAIFFTSGSTGIPKGVEWSHGNMQRQGELLTQYMKLEPDDIDVATFPLFMFITTAANRTCIIPDMDFSAPAQVEPQNIVQLIEDFGANYCFGSPALLNKVSLYCVEKGITLPTMKHVISGGAPVPFSVIERVQSLLPNGLVVTPYGATEALPISFIDSTELQEETGDLSAQGWGTCVGYPVPDVDVKIIRSIEQPIAEWSESLALADGEIGEITVKGPIVTEKYFRRPQEVLKHKISEYNSETGSTEIRHRMGDVGYFDQKGRLWFCGRKNHICFDATTPYYSVKVEGIVNAVNSVWRSALVELSTQRGPELAIVIEFHPGECPDNWNEKKSTFFTLLEKFDIPVKHLYHYPKSFPVDKRHNSKIERSVLAKWAQTQL